MADNDPEVAEPASNVRFQGAFSFPTEIRLSGSAWAWPVGTEAAAGGRSRQPQCYAKLRLTWPFQASSLPFAFVTLLRAFSHSELSPSSATHLFT